MKALNYLFISFFLISVPLFSQQREIAVTVYNNNLAVIKDIRQLELEEGIFELRYQNVASKIDPTSVHFKSLTAPSKVNIFEQNFEFDLVNPDKIMEKYIDKSISVYTKQDSAFQGKLLNKDRNYLVLQEPAGTVKLISKANITNINFPELPEGLITRPTLVWKIFNKQQDSHRTEVSYMTSGIQWHAEYVAVTRENDQLLELNAWVSVENYSGATYPNAKLKLIAGDVNLVQESKLRREMPTAKNYLFVADAAPQFKEKSFFEYHLYTLDKPTTIKDNQIKQISLFSPAEVKVKKIYTFEPKKSADKIRVNLEFKNDKSAGLGIPLPAGKVRVYKEDADDHSLEFIGEDKLDHTPKNEKIRLFLGNAFDVKAERSMSEKKSTGKRSHDETWQVKIRNHKDKAIDVLVIEKFYGFWKIKQASHSYKKESAQKLTFTVHVPQNKEVVLTYTIAFQKR